MSGGKKKKEKAKTLKKKEKKFNFVNPNQLRKNLLNKIKEHREVKELEQKPTPVKEENIEKFSSNFNDSMNYLSDLVEKEKKSGTKSGTKSKRKKKNRTLKGRSKGGHSNFDPEDIEVNLKLPTDFTNNVFSTENEYNKVSTILPPAPPYGCLKGGSVPTFRQWRTTTQKNIGFSSDDDDDDNNEDDDFENHIKEIEKEKSQTTDSSFTKPMINIEKSLPPSNERENKLNNLRQKKGGYVTKKTLKRKYKLGKSKKNNSISVLIKSTQTKKKIMDEKKKIENEDISTIKKYLRQHNLIRIGSTTPNDVLKTMYESAILSGYVNNSSDDVMLHNYLNNGNY
jgi:hypothetical protein